MSSQYINLHNMWISFGTGNIRTKFGRSCLVDSFVGDKFSLLQKCPPFLDRSEARELDIFVGGKPSFRRRQAFLTLIPLWWVGGKHHMAPN